MMGPGMVADELVSLGSSVIGFSYFLFRKWNLAGLCWTPCVMHLCLYWVSLHVNMTYV